MALDRPLEAHLPAHKVSGDRKPKPEIADLETRVGHVFADPDLLNRALTHVSAAPSESARLGTYQRLEFLGDRVLGLAVADMLYQAFPSAHEGELSRRFADLVRRETCAEVAAEWGAGPYIRLGAGEARTGGRKKTAILADICESLIGAVFVDKGFVAAREVVNKAWRDRMLAPKHALRDAKTALQEWAQARGLAAPTYSETARMGPHHAPEFLIRVEIAGFEPLEARGRSKRMAEQAVARAFLVREGVALAPSEEEVSS
ncbi:MAG TPA: ribonuclease III [Beijerinckiaceae bacterium]|nr:ribonuclease III [Beijerinckiaceae bacterium]